MFDAKDEGQLSGDDLLLQSLDDLKHPNKFYNGYNEVDHYVKQGNLASYLGVRPVHAIHVPIPVNLIFIGFNGTGNQGISMREADMRRWLEHMDHVEEHTRSPLNWHTHVTRLAHAMGARGAVGGRVVVGDEDDEEEEEVEAEGAALEHDLPLISNVHYNYTIHVMEMGERMGAVFESAVRALSRLDDPTAAPAHLDDDDDPPDATAHPHPSSSSSLSSSSAQPPLYQVDMEGMAHVVDNLLDSLQLDAVAYNIIVLNLNHARTRRRYGYRLGLSTAEFNMLQADDRRRQHLLSPGLEKVPQVLDVGHVPQPLFSSRPGHKLAWHHIQPHEILPWASRFSSLIGSLDRVVNERSDARDNAARKAQQMLTTGDPRRAHALRTALGEHGSDGGGGASWHEQCLTDTWIGSRRWALIDLSAGPFSWGPLPPPSVPAAAAATPTARSKRSAAGAGAAAGGAGAGAGAGSAGVNGSSSGVESAWSSSMVGVGASAAWGVKSESSLPSVDRYFDAISHAATEASEGELMGHLARMAEERLEAVEVGEDAQHEVDVLLAEMDVYDAFADRHCRGRVSKSALCQELLQKLEDAKDHLAMQGGRPATGSMLTGASVRAALERLHSWKFQSVPPDRHAGKEDEGGSSPAVTRAWDMLMAELAASLSSAMRHVITPSTAAGAYHFYERVSFHLYVISHQPYYERRHTPQYVDDFKAEVQKLSLPGQHFQFTTYRLSVAEDAALATAFSSSLRAAVSPAHPLLPASGAGNDSAGSAGGGRVQLYLDSRVLQHQLRSLGDDSLHRLKRTRGERALLDVPVFFFALASDPILIDQSLLAKALPDMVLSVQLAQPHWPTGVTCNGREMHADLRDPLAAVLAATMEHLAGLLPAHLSFSTAHSAVTQDWRWAAGGHPLAAIGGGLLGGGGASSARVSVLQRDAMARSFVVTALDEAVARVNRAVATLAAETTHEDTYAVFKRWERALSAQYNAVVEGWRRVAAAVEAMDYGGAVGLLPAVESSAARWEQEVWEVVASLHPARCTKQRRVQVGRGGLLPLLCLLSLLLLVLLCLLLRRRKIKPKVN
ncbi:hypothetical protein CLOM_g17773 [Closterium sp. NIES-68]|nr:hypothetical protein CLOM_g17773 [Closterium sp. NIES-68]GJP61541.1 hypothetical protein CLOP_g18687 [Closterium sp. NIES-67]